MLPEGLARLDIRGGAVDADIGKQMVGHRLQALALFAAVRPGPNPGDKADGASASGRGVNACVCKACHGIHPSDLSGAGENGAFAVVTKVLSCNYACKRVYLWLLDKENLALETRRRLPPLNAVRAFEAAARHGGFVSAADELAVTASAISQQVKSLEEWLGQPLFIRRAQGLELTPTGRRYLSPLTDALDRIDAATRAVSPRKQSRTLTVSALSSFVAQWLAPRISKFVTEHPDIDLRLSTTDVCVNLAQDDVDIAIRYGMGHDTGVESHVLSGEVMMPVCAPWVAERIKTPDDLAGFVLMHDTTAGLLSTLTWQGWIREIGRRDLEKRLPIDRGPGFSDSHFLVQAAIGGQGVMIGRSILVADALRNGSLVAPFEDRVASPYKYRFLTLPGGAEEPKAAAFKAWLTEEIKPYRVD